MTAGGDGSATDHPWIGRTLGGHYRLEAVLGRGAAGTVFRARHTLLDDVFAVKVLHPGMAGDEMMRARFLREARTLTRFTHRHAVQVRHCGEQEGLLFIAMDVCPGESLDALLEREPILPPRRAVAITLQVLEALTEAHRAGIVHRDLKPGNIMVNGDEVCVVDFGVARLMGTDTRPGPPDDVTLPGDILGTIAYMSPEQLRAEEVDGRSDLFSLGTVLHEMLSGKRTFGEGAAMTVMRHILDKPPVPLPRKVGAETPDWLRSALSRALEKDRRQRFQSAAEFAAALRPPATGTAAAATPRRRWPLVAAVLVVAALAMTWGIKEWRRSARLEDLRARALGAYLGSRFQDSNRLYSQIVREGSAGGEDFLYRAKARRRLQRSSALEDLDRARDLLPGDPRVDTERAAYQLLRGDMNTLAHAAHFVDARESLTRALRDDPGHLPARTERIRILIRTRMVLYKNQFDAWRSVVEGELERLEKRAPRSARLEILRSRYAQTLSEAGFDPVPQLGRASAAATRAIRSDPLLADAHLQMANALYETSQNRRATGELEVGLTLSRAAAVETGIAIRLAKTHPLHEEQGAQLAGYLEARTRRHIEARQFDGARSDIEECLALNPTDPSVVQGCAYLSTQIGEFDRAIELYNRLLDVAVDDPRTLFLLAFSVQQLGTQSRDIGRLQLADKQLNSALELYRRGLRLSPRDADLNNYSAETLVVLATMSEGEEQARHLAAAWSRFQLLEEDGHKPDRYRRAHYWLVAGRPRSALDEMIPPVDHRGWTPAMWARLALCITRVLSKEQLTGKQGEELLTRARNACRQARVGDPERSSASAYVLEGGVLEAWAHLQADERSRGEWLGKALAAYRSAVDTGAQRPMVRARAHYRTADLLLSLGRKGEAVEEVRRGVELRESESEAGEWFLLHEDYTRLADVFEAAGRTDDAAEARKRALAAEPAD